MCLASLSAPKVPTSGSGQLAMRAPAVLAAMTDPWLAVQATMDARLRAIVKERVEWVLELDQGSASRITYSTEEQSFLALEDRFVIRVAEVTEQHLAGPCAILAESGLRDLLPGRN